MVKEKDFRRFLRGIPSGPFTQRDVDLAGDVRKCQTMLDALVQSSGARNIVEIGCADGSTTIALLHAASITGGKVVSCDPSDCADAIALVERCGYSHLWRFEHMTSDEMFNRGLCPPAIEFAYIDGDHACDFVARDMMNLSLRLAVGGCIVSHDWQSYDPDEDLLDATPEEYGAARGVLAAMRTLQVPMFLLPIMPDAQHRIRGTQDAINRSESSLFIMQRAANWNVLEYYKAALAACWNFETHEVGT